MTIFSPSAAPRWEITTRRLVRRPGSTAPNAARVRKLGSAVVPTTANAPLRRKMRRVIDIKSNLNLQLSSLKLRRPENQSLNRSYIWGTLRIVQLALADLRIVQLFADRVVRLLRNVAGEQRVFETRQRLLRVERRLIRNRGALRRKIHGIDLHSTYFSRRQAKREIHASK